MVLLCPVAVGIHLAHHGQEAVLVLADFQLRHLLATHSLLKDGLNLRIGILFVIKLLKTMVAELTAVGSEEIMAILQGIDHVSEPGDGDTTHLLQLVYIGGKVCRFYVHRSVRTPCGEHHGVVSRLVGSILYMVVQVIDRVVSGADTLHVIVSHQSTC